MNYLIVRPHRSSVSLCNVSIAEAGTALPLPYSAWILDNGYKVMCAMQGLHSKLRQQYMSGTYEDGALFAVSYEEMCLIVTSMLRDKDEASKYREAVEWIEPKAPSEPGIWQRPALVFCWRLLCLISHIAWRALVTVTRLFVVGFVLKIMSKRR